MAVATPSEILEWLRFGATIVTPLAVLWLGIRAANRRKLMESIDEKLENLRKEQRDGREECREDVHAVAVQFSAFQREVAAEYPRRTEISDTLREIRDDLRDLNREQISRWRDDPRR